MLRAPDGTWTVDPALLPAALGHLRVLPANLPNGEESAAAGPLALCHAHLEAVAAEEGIALPDAHLERLLAWDQARGEYGAELQQARHLVQQHRKENAIRSHRKIPRRV